MKARWLLPVFALVAAIQLVVPAGMIVRHAATLRYGRVYKFRTRPVDPYDAFRGRYVWLGFEQDHARWRGETDRIYRQKGYGRVEEGSDGYAVIRELTPKPPSTGDWLKVEVLYPGWGTNIGSTYFRLPFDRYYVEEAKASKAEKAYWQHQNRRSQTNENTYAVIRIWNGESALEDLYIGGKPIAEVLRKTALHEP
jgi:uncharacterized membrane-anchored protein